MKKLSTIVFVLALLLGVAPVAADGPGNPTLLAADGTSPILTPDGAAVVYLAPYGPSWEQGLFAVAPTGGSPVELSQGLTNGQYIDQFWVSPDSRYAVFKLADPDRSTTDLYSVPIDGGPSTMLNPQLEGGDGVSSVEVSPDSARVVFVTQAGPEVFSAPIDGGTPVRLSPPVDDVWNAGGGHSARISPDANLVVLVSREPATFIAQLLVTPITERDLTKLAEHPVGIGQHQISPDSKRVVYMGGDGSFDLFSVRLDGTVPPVELAERLGSEEGSSASFTISPDSQWVVIRRADRQDPPLLSTVAIDGGDEIPIGVYPPGRVSGWRYEISSDSRQIIYVGQILGEGPYELFREPIGGGDREMLTGAPGAGDDVVGFTVAGDPELVVYTARSGPAEQWDVFTIPASGGAALQLTDGFNGGYGAVGAPLTSPDLSRTVFAARTGPSNTLELYVVPTTGGTTLQLNGLNELLLTSGKTSVSITPDSTRVAYTADPKGIYSVPIGVECAGQFATIVGTSGNDTLIGTPHDDVIHGRGGDDLIRAKGGHDLVCAGRGNDTVYGGRGGDAVIGGPGADSIWGRRGWDELRGGAGPDMLDGGRGIDSCFGGPGNDTLTRCE